MKGGRKKEKRKKGKKAKIILELGFEMWIYISKHCEFFSILIKINLKTFWKTCMNMRKPSTMHLFESPLILHPLAT